MLKICLIFIKLILFLFSCSTWSLTQLTSRTFGTQFVKDPATHLPSQPNWFPYILLVYTPNHCVSVNTGIFDGSIRFNDRSHLVLPIAYSTRTAHPEDNRQEGRWAPAHYCRKLLETTSQDQDLHVSSGFLSAAAYRFHNELWQLFRLFIKAGYFVFLLPSFHSRTKYPSFIQCLSDVPSLMSLCISER